MDNVCSFSIMIKIRWTSPTNVWQRNKILLCHYQHTFMVNWSEEDQFASDNKAIHYRYILLEHPRTSDTVCHSCRKHGDREVFSVKDRYNWLRNTIMTDLLENLVIIAVSGHTILLKTDICSAFMSIHPLSMMASSLFIDSWFY